MRLRVQFSRWVLAGVFPGWRRPGCWCSAAVMPGLVMVSLRWRRAPSEVVRAAAVAAGVPALRSAAAIAAAAGGFFVMARSAARGGPCPVSSSSAVTGRRTCAWGRGVGQSLHQLPSSLSMCGGVRPVA